MERIRLKVLNLILKRRSKSCYILILASIFLCQNIYSQGKKYPFGKTDYYNNARDSIINTADYIFEGIVVRSNIEPSIKGYYNDDKSMIYTAVKINITKILRGDGNLKPGTAVVFRKGGAIMDYSNNTAKMIDSRLGFGHSISDLNTQLFFCKKNEYPEKNLFEVENEQSLSIFYDVEGWQMIYKKDANKNYSGLGGMRFNSINQLYRFLYDFDNIEKKSDVSLKSATIESSPLKSSQLKHDEIKRKELERQKFMLDYFHSNKAKESTLKNATAGSDISFFLRNPKNTGINTTDRYFEFDIYVKASSFNTYLYNAVIRIEYETGLFNPFYSNSAADGYITLTNGADFNNSNYEAATVYDHTNSIMSINISTGTIDPVSRTEITTSSLGKQLIHVKIKIKDDKVDTELTLTDGGDSYVYPLLNMYTNSSTDSWMNGVSYDNSYFLDNPATFLLAPSPTINSFTTSATAGAGTLVTIYGSSFGSKVSTQAWQNPIQQVQFLNADDGSGTNYLKGLDQDDYVLWQDDRIELILPSWVYMIGEHPNLLPPGSGKFEVITDWGKDDKSSSEIDIQYSINSMTIVSNDGNPNNDKQRISLPRLNCVNGIQFKLGTSIASNSLAVVAIERALLVWSNHLGIDLSLEYISPGNPTTIASNSIYATDGINLISYDNLNEVPNQWMGTVTHRQSSYNYSCGSNNNYGQKQADIRIYEFKNWNYNITGSSISSGYDFYGAILHEIGHALGLRHVLEDDDLMHPNQVEAPSASQRKTLTSGRGMAANGATNIINTSKSINWSCGSNVETLGSSTTICTNLSPNTPQNLNASPVSISSISLTWSSIANATSYVLEYSTQAITGFQQLANPTGSSYTHTGLSAGTPYYYKIKARNISSDSPFSNIVTATTLFSGGGSAPTAPTDPSGSVVSPSQIQIVWNDNSSNETGFIIERSTTSGSGYTTVGNVNANATSFTDDNVISNTQYYYRIKTFNSVGSSGYSNEISIVNIYIIKNIVCTPKSQIHPSTSGVVDYNIQLIGGGSWTATEETDYDWLDITEGVIGNNSGQITLSFLSNPGGVRIANIIISSPYAVNNPFTIKLTQLNSNDVALVIDRSGSMGLFGYMKPAKTAASNFIGLMQDGDNVSVVSFSNTASIILPFTSINPTTKQTAIDEISMINSSGTTSIGAGLQVAQGELNNGNPPVGTYQNIVLLSDGHENTPPLVEEVITDIIGKSKVYAIGLGDLSDENFLNDIANQTSGLYRKSAKADLQEIYNTVGADIKQQEIIASLSGFIKNNDIKVNTVNIDPSVSVANFAITWPGSNIDLKLINPEGNEYDHSTNSENVSLIIGETFESYIINNPISGKWTIQYEGIETEPTGEPFHLLVSAFAGLTIDLTFNKDYYFQYYPIIVSAAIKEGDYPITNSLVSAKVTLPDLSSVNVLLYDNGSNGDEMANDGIYSNYFYNTILEGSYTFKVDAIGKDYQRSITKSTVVEKTSSPDLFVLNVPNDYTTIQEAIDNAKEMEGAKVLVQEGIYNERITLYNNIWLVATGDPAKTIIDGGNKQNVVSMEEVYSGGIIGFTIQNSAKNGQFAGIKCTGDQSPVIANCIIKNNNNGLFIAGNVRSVISNNNILDNNSSGIRIVGNSPSIIFNNIISGNSKGIEAKGQPVDVHGYNNIWNNSVNISGIENGIEDISNDPMFTDALSNNYHLVYGSPCIDAGHIEYNDINGTRSNIGVYGGLFERWINSIEAHGAAILSTLPQHKFGHTGVALSFSNSNKGTISDFVFVKKLNKHAFLDKGINSIGVLWDIYSDQNTASKITIRYLAKEVQSSLLDENSLKIAFYNEETKKWVELASTVDKETKTISAIITNTKGYWTIGGDSEGEAINDINIDKDIDDENIVNVYPNPSNKDVTIAFSLKEKSNVIVDIYSLTGRRICSLSNNQLFNEGNNEIRWNLKSDNGNAIDSGIYIYHVKSAEFEEAGKITIFE